MKTEILVVRDDDAFSRILVKRGFSVINFPTIKIEKIDDDSELKRAIEEIENFDGIFITSPNAAAPFLKRFIESKKNFCGKIYVLGKRTNELFRTAKFTAVFDENLKSAEDLLASIPESDLKRKKFLYLRGNRSLRVIPERLKGIAEVEEVIVYKTAATKPAREKSEEIAEKFKKNRISAVCFFSPSGVEEFLSLFEDFSQNNVKITSIGKTTAKFIESKNLRVDFISSKPAAEDFAIELIKFLERNLAADVH